MTPASVPAPASIVDPTFGTSGNFAAAYSTQFKRKANHFQPTQVMSPQAKRQRHRGHHADRPAAYPRGRIAPVLDRFHGRTRQNRIAGNRRDIFDGAVLANHQAQGDIALDASLA